jgi:hypothetical protein
MRIAHHVRRDSRPYRTGRLKIREKPFAAGAAEHIGPANVPVDKTALVKFTQRLQ